MRKRIDPQNIVVMEGGKKFTSQDPKEVRNYVYMSYDKRYYGASQPRSKGKGRQQTFSTRYSAVSIHQTKQNGLENSGIDGQRRLEGIYF